jgi:DNA-binding transcriptional ArsR family regulator
LQETFLQYISEYLYISFTHEALEIFRALADPTRLAAFESVAAQELSVSELTQRFDVSQPAISQHLAALRISGLVQQRKEGRQVYYRVDLAGIKPLFSWIGRHEAFWPEKLPRPKTLLQELPNEKSKGE